MTQPAKRTPADPLPFAVVGDLIDHHRQARGPRLARLWRYYRNAERRLPDAGRTLPAQAEGLPRRLLKPTDGFTPPREIVIENDIAWRIHTLVDFMFPAPVPIRSTADDPGRAELIQRFLRGVFECNGGIDFFQNLALLGSIYGHIDVLLRPRPAFTATPGDTPVESLARRFRLEVVDPLRGLPRVNPHDYRRLDAYLIHNPAPTPPTGRGAWLRRLGQRLMGNSSGAGDRTEAWTRDSYLRFATHHGEHRLERRSVNRLGRIPVVHIQNLPQPFFYEGLSEVEPLIPLQDELNTRLSDRANRVTMQSFKMYLGKGIEGFLDRTVGPGQMWTTDNPDAEIVEFGGDAESPSEESHIREVREALDKASGVSPVATGLVSGKVGNLTSENAIRIVLMGLVAKTTKKRTSYGQGLARLCELILDAADTLGVLPNAPEERGVRFDWPSPVPVDETQALRNAALKREIGVPEPQVLAELGYGVDPPNPSTD